MYMCFFFSSRRRHTRFDCDWSSDVCSSDLDYDGTVTSALLGAGAADRTQCFYNAVFGGNDNYGSLATYEHALVDINGQCALQTSQLPEINYRLVRAIGHLLGVGWTQLNVNVHTGSRPA